MTKQELKNGWYVLPHNARLKNGDVCIRREGDPNYIAQVDPYAFGKTVSDYGDWIFYRWSEKPITEIPVTENSAIEKIDVLKLKPDGENAHVVKMNNITVIAFEINGIGFSIRLDNESRAKLARLLAIPGCKK